jgi:hypothetical protein
VHLGLAVVGGLHRGRERLAERLEHGGSAFMRRVTAPVLTW